MTYPDTIRTRIRTLCPDREPKTSKNDLSGHNPDIVIFDLPSGQ